MKTQNEAMNVEQDWKQHKTTTTTMKKIKELQ